MVGKMTMRSGILFQIKSLKVGQAHAQTLQTLRDLGL